jgi:hypothetical protein
MIFEHIETLKKKYTDKYVVVDASQPELARFRGLTGMVKTVNMSGRALVEFNDYHLNIGWYDIDTEFLKVVDKPPPKAPKAEVKKAPAKAQADAKAPAKPAPAAGAKAGKPSVADILAAARGGKAAAPATPKAKAETAPAAPAQADAPDKPAKVDRSKMSVAEMLAAARAGGAGGGAAKPQALPPPVAKAQAEAAPTQEAPRVEEAAAEAVPRSDPAPAVTSVKRVDKSNMSIDDIVAWCRQHDAK